MWTPKLPESCPSEISPEQPDTRDYGDKADSSVSSTESSQYNNLNKCHGKCYTRMTKGSKMVFQNRW